MNAYKLLTDFSSSIQINCSDIFIKGSDYTITVPSEDIDWMITVIEKYGEDGLNAAVAYLINKNPLDIIQTDNFIKAIEFLKNIDPKITMDNDYYNEEQFDVEGLYRKKQVEI